jgi:hypothetical protein
MRTIIAVTALAAGISLAGSFALSQNAAALPIAANAIGQSATAAPDVTQVQYSEKRTRHGIKKCYREFVVGNYVCRYY